MNKKSIKELAWDVSEDIYRADPAKSYSMLAAFFREGPSIIPHLDEKKSSDALKRGSLVDTLLTEPEEFENKFVIAEVNKPSDTMCQIVESLWLGGDKTTGDLDKISDEVILRCANSKELYPGYKEETRIKKVRELGSNYFSLLSISEGKTIMSQFEYNQAIACVDTLKNHVYTRDYFFDDPFDDETESYYQLKFKTDSNPFVRIMFDRIICNHKDKTIQPIDLKTTGKNEELFDHSFIDWSYWIQSNMYSQVLQHVCSKDEYFKDFKILPFKFIVINRDSLSPIVWTDKNNLVSGDRIDCNGKVYPYWKRLYEDFCWHFDNNYYQYTHKTYNLKGERELTNLKIVNE